MPHFLDDDSDDDNGTYCDLDAALAAALMEAEIEDQAELERRMELRRAPHGIAASSFNVGDRVRRGPDWEWGDQDGGLGNAGTITEVDSDGWVRVKWDKGGSNKYRTENAGGTDLVKATVGEYVVSGAGGICVSTINGTYSYTRQHNSAPLYTKEGGKAILYYGGRQWRINDTDSTSGWYYSKKGSSGSVPCGQWTNDGYSGSDVLPCPTVTRVGLPPPSLSLQASSGTTSSCKASLDAIIVKGSDRQVDCDGVYVRESSDRNGSACYTRESNPGAIYYDGSHWKICQQGSGKSETGWNYSQEGPSAALPLGQWLSSKATRETTRDYSQLHLRVATASGHGSSDVQYGSGAGARPQLSATVLVLSASDSSTRPYVGQTGRLLEDDKSGRPFKVEFGDGQKWWFKEGEIQNVGSLHSSCVGARVRVKRSVSRPTYGWGPGVTHDKVGIVKRVDPDGDLKVDFPDHKGWKGKSSEMEVVAVRVADERRAERRDERRAERREEEELELALAISASLAEQEQSEQRDRLAAAARAASSSGPSVVPSAPSVVPSSGPSVGPPINMPAPPAHSPAQASSQAAQASSQASSPPPHSPAPPEETVCIICMDEPRNATLVHGDTGHVCCCLKCAQDLKAKGLACPMCRKPIDVVIRQFTA